MKVKQITGENQDRRSTLVFFTGQPFAALILPMLTALGFEKRVLEWTNRRLARARQMLAAKGLGMLTKCRQLLLGRAYS